MKTGIKIGDEFADLFPKQKIKIKRYNGLFDLDNPKGEYSMPIKFPMTKKNRRLFGVNNRINSTINYAEIDCTVFVSGIFYDDAIFIIEGVNDEEIEGYLLTGISLLFQKIKTTYIDEIDYHVEIPFSSQDDLLLYMQNTVSNPNSIVVFGEIVSKGFADGFMFEQQGDVVNFWNYNTNTYFKIDEKYQPHSTSYVPMPKLYFVLQKMFNHFGYTLSWDLINTSDFKKLAIVNNRALIKKHVATDYVMVANPTIHPVEGHYWTHSQFQAPTYSNHQVLIKNGYVDLIGHNGPLPTNNFEFLVSGPSPFQNKDDLFNLQEGSFIIPSKGANINIEIDIDAKRDSPHRETTTLGSWQVNWVALLVVNLFIDNEIVGRIQSDHQELRNEWVHHHKIVNNIKIPASNERRNVDVKIALFFSNNPQSAIPGGAVEQASIVVNKFKISFNEPLIYEIPYRGIAIKNHLAHIKCSDFFSTIRTRFGAYIKEIDRDKKIVKLEQLNNLHSQVPINQFKKRNPSITQKRIKNKFTWNYEDLSNYADKFPALSISASDDRDIEDNEMSFNLEPVDADKANIVVGSHNPETNTGELFSYTRAFIAKREMTASPIGSDEPVVNYLAFFQGFRRTNPYNTIKAPLLEALNWTPYEGYLGSWCLKWNENRGLYKTFLEAWYKYLLEYSEVEMTIYPSTTEAINFNLYAIDFYHFMSWVYKQIDFSFDEKGELPIKATMVKIDSK